MVTPRKVRHEVAVAEIEPPVPNSPPPLLMRRWSGLASGLLLGTALDALIADPKAAHPVAAFGLLASRAEARLWAGTRSRGLLFTVACVAPVAAGGWALQRGARRSPLRDIGLTTAATWTVLGASSLASQASTVADALSAGDLAAARERLPALCGRDPRHLDAPEIARATVESVAENTSDATVAPLFWGAAAGVPGMLAYRAVNTLDAMVGHRSPRYERFGWAAARLDDVANWLPARLTALLTVALAPAAGGSPRRALTTWRRDGAAHPSPNAGRCEAAFAGALGVRLGGTNVYHGRAEQRGVLGDGPPPTATDIARAVRLSRFITVAAARLSAAAPGLRANRRQP